MRISDWSSDVCSSDLVAFLTIGELAGQARDVHRALAPRQFARLFRGFARRGGVDDLLDHRLGISGLFLEPFGLPVGHQAFARLAHPRRHRLALGLPAELRLEELYRTTSCQPLSHFFSRHTTHSLL